MLARILTIIAACSLAASVAFAGYQYREVHLPEFTALKADFDYYRCIQDCQAVCRANGVSVDKCKCPHCEVYR